jgi:hypothetical protein
VIALRLLADHESHLPRPPDATELAGLLLQAADQLDGKVRRPSPPARWMLDLLSGTTAPLDEHARRRAARILAEARDEAARRRQRTRQDVDEILGVLELVDAADAELETSLALLGADRARTARRAAPGRADDDA